MKPIQLAVYPGERTASITFDGRTFAISGTALRHLADLARMDLKNASPAIRFMEPIIQAMHKLADELCAASTGAMTDAQRDLCLQRYNATGCGADMSGVQEYLAAAPATAGREGE